MEDGAEDGAEDGVEGGKGGRGQREVETFSIQRRRKERNGRSTARPPSRHPEVSNSLSFESFESVLGTFLLLMKNVASVSVLIKFNY